MKLYQRFRFYHVFLGIVVILPPIGASSVWAQAPSTSGISVPAAHDLQQCQLLPDNERLSCYDHIVAQLPPSAAQSSNPIDSTVESTWDLAIREQPENSQLTAVTDTTDRSSAITSEAPPSTLERMWELRADTQRSMFSLQPYGPNYVLIGQYGDRVNRQPSSPAPGRGDASYKDYRQVEAKFQLSVRAKIGRNLLREHDSLWFGYTQVSQWQVWSGNISRPFRATSYKPEILYIVPIQYALPGDWTLRLAGVGLIHESNGQSNPLSRSWNRFYLGLGFDRADMSLYTRFWARFPEDYGDDDNPDIKNYMGRADARFEWQVTPHQTIATTWTTNLRASSKGSIQLDYFFPLSSLWGLGDNLRGYVQIFHGYGETITDYNFRRTAIGIGLALKEW